MEDEWACKLIAGPLYPIDFFSMVSKSLASKNEDERNELKDTYNIGEKILNPSKAFDIEVNKKINLSRFRRILIIFLILA